MQRKVTMSRADASMRLHALMHGEKTRWWYAFAMGSGCAIENGNDEVMRAIRDEDALLRSILEPEGQANHMTIQRCSTCGSEQGFYQDKSSGRQRCLACFAPQEEETRAKAEAPPAPADQASGRTRSKQQAAPKPAVKQPLPDTGPVTQEQARRVEDRVAKELKR